MDSAEQCCSGGAARADPSGGVSRVHRMSKLFRAMLQRVPSLKGTGSNSGGSGRMEKSIILLEESTRGKTRVGKLQSSSTWCPLAMP
ncbi:hypothetical protein Dimus_024184 [Dionaea muscipula]